MKQIQLLIVFILISQTVFAGGPWPQKKGGLYLKLSEWWTIFDEHYTDQGRIDPNQTIGIFNTTVYAEYGLTDRVTAIVNAPILSRNVINNIRSATTQELLIPGDAITTFGDTDVTLKYGITKPGAKIPIAASLTFGLPTGKAVAGDQNNLQTGDGEFNQLVQLHAGTGFKIADGLSSYVSTYVGYNNRSKGFSEEIRFGAEIGIGLINDKLWLNGRLNVVESLKNGDTAATTTSTSIFANNTEFTNLGIEANVYLTPTVGISAGVASAIRGEIIAAAAAYNVGIFVDLK
jgi:hypothetical protein